MIEMTRKVYTTLKIMLILSFFLMQIDLKAQANTTPKIWIVSQDGSGNFNAIQEAILNDSVSAGDTILVRKGTYIENLVINKSISLVGESVDETVINSYTSTGIATISIEADEVSIINFTITSSSLVSSAVSVLGYRKTIISHNKIIHNNDGIVFAFSGENVVFANTFDGNKNTGISFYFSTNNTVSGNTFKNNTFAGIYLYSSNGNIFYHNNFYDFVPVISDAANIFNLWDYDGEGNYWSNYNGTDFYRGAFQNETGSDGIGDEPYIIDKIVDDRFPLLGAFSFYDVHLKSEDYRFTFISNSTVSDFSFEVGVETENKLVRFNVIDEDGSVGFCRVWIPRRLMNHAIVVLVDDEEITPTWLGSTEEYACIYFTYIHSARIVKIISSKTLDLYYELLAEYVQLQDRLGSLNMSYYGLLNDLSALLDSYTRLQGDYTELYGSYQELLGKYDKNVQNIQNLAYAFLATTALFIIVTIYLTRYMQKPRSLERETYNKNEPI